MSITYKKTILIALIALFAVGCNMDMSKKHESAEKKEQKKEMPADQQKDVKEQQK